jgi:carboxymethylenebutenolidase
MDRQQTITSEDGRSFDAYLALPNASVSRVAVLLLPEMFGLSGAMCEAADDFAQAGFAMAVPNVFWRSEHPRTLDYEGVDRQLAWERIQAFDFERVIADIDTAAAWLREKSGATEIVALGHCIGGRLAVLALRSNSVAGAISYYGLGIAKQGTALAEIRKPVQLHYGLADQHVPMSEIDAVSGFAAGNPAIEIFRYDGAGHSFCNPNRPMFNVEAAALVRRRTLEFLAALPPVQQRG